MLQVWGKGLLNRKNIKLDFEKELSVRENTVLRVSSNYPFRVTVNGEQIGYGPRRMAFGNSAINEYSLCDFAEKKVIVSIEVVCYRVENYYVENQTPFFAGEIEENGKIVCGSADFDCYKDNRREASVRRFSFQRGFTEYYDYSQKRERINVEEVFVCRLRESSVPYPRFERLKFSRFESGKIVFSENHREFWDKIKEKINFIDPVPPLYNVSDIFGNIGFRKCAEQNDESGYYRLFSLPALKTGFIEVEISVEEDASVIVYFDERISEEKPPFLYDGASYVNPYQRSTVSLIRYFLPKGKYSLRSFEPNTMRYCGVAVYEGKATINGLSLLTYENGGENLYFRCDDEDLQTMMSAAVNTFNQSCVDILMDCPSRERAGWLADTYFSGRAERFINGNNAIEQNTLRCFLERKNEENLPKEAFPMCYPADHKNGTYIPNWGMWLILELLDYKKRSGDDALVEAFREQVFNFVNYHLRYLDKNGLLCGVKYWVFVEWSKANSLTQDVNFPTNMLFYATLCAVRELYKTDEYADIAEKMKEAIYRYGYDGKFFLDNATVTESGYEKKEAERTEVCQYYAFYFGFADEKRNPELYRFLFEDIRGRGELGENYCFLERASNFFGLYLRLDYLASKVSGKRLAAELKEYFLSEAKETGTYWEFHTAKESCCHGFCSVIAEFILKAVFGLRGFDEFDNLILERTNFDKNAEAEFFRNGKKYILKNVKGEITWETECLKK